MAKKKFIPRPKESERVIRKRWTKKRDSIENLSNNVQKLRYNVSLGLKNESKNEKNFLTCLVIAIMDKSFERVGNEASAANGKVGITGLNKDQVTIIGNKIILEYTGKSGVEHEKMFSDAKIAKALKIAKKNSPDENVFTTSKGFKIRNNRINRYLSDFGILSKNLRGYGANNLLVKKLSELEPEETEAKRKVQFNKVARFVAKKVGHGLPTLKKHYMIPEIEPNFIEFSKVIEIDDVSKFNDGGTIKAEEKTKKTKPSENPNVDKFTCEDAIPDSKLKKSLPKEIEDILKEEDSFFKDGGEVIKPKIIVHNNTDSASDKDAQKIIINYLKNINESGHKKFFEFLKKSNQNINDYEAVFYLSKDYYDKNVGKYYSNKIIYQKNVSDAYQNALNYDDAYPNFIRIYKHGNIKGFAATTEFDLFGDWEGDKYDDNGRLKQELKEQAIQQLKKDLYVTNNQNSGEYKMKEGGDIKNLGNDILPIGSIIYVKEFRSYHKYEVVGFVEKREGSGIRYDVYELKADMSGVKGKKTQITFPYPNTKTKFRYNATIPKEGSKLISQSEIDSEKRRGSESEVVIKWEGNKPSYLMTKEEYKSIVTPKMKEFNKFISKNKEYFSKKDYYGIDYLDFESFKSIHEPSQYSTVERDFLQRSKTSEGTVPKQADEKLIKELNEYKDYFANIFGRENIKKIEDDEVGNNKRSIRRAIDSGVYEKLLREGKINYTFLKTVFDSVGINIPTKLEKIESEVVDKGITSDVQISLKEKTENFFSNLKRLFEKEIRFYADTFKEHYIESIKRMKNFCDRHKEFVNYDTFAYNYSINNNYQPTPIYENVRGIQKLKGYNYHPDIQKLFFLNKIFENSGSNESVRFFIADNWEELLEVRALDYANDLFKNFGRRILQETEVINSIDKNFPEIQNARVLRLTEKGFEANFDLKYPNGFVLSVETQVIYAGGYNIQALHLRGLFKFQYKGKFISEKELIEAYKSFSGEEKTIEKGSLIINEISIPENIDVLLKEKYTLNNHSDFYSSELRKLAGESGLVSEEVRKSDEYIRLNVKSKISFKKLQEFNESEKNKTIDDFVRKLDRVTQQKIRNNYSGNIEMQKGGDMLLAPNGKKSNLTPEQYNLVRTPEFISWFGDWINEPENASKVVDENGEPLVCYHKTNNKFTIFDKEKLGSSSGWDTAYFGFYFSNKYEKTAYGKIAVKCFLNIKNPYYIISETYSDFDYDYKKFDVNNFSENDGVIIKTNRLILGDKADKHFVAFESNQIKLSNGTNTTFDSNNPDIRFDDGGDVNNEFSSLKIPFSKLKSAIQKVNSGLYFDTPQSHQPHIIQDRTTNYRSDVVSIIKQWFKLNGDTLEKGIGLDRSLVEDEYYVYEYKRIPELGKFFFTVIRKDKSPIKCSEKDLDIKVKKVKLNNGGSVNPYAVCTISIGKTEDTQKRSYWSEEGLDKYERCVLKVKAKMSNGGELKIEKKKVYEGDKILRDMPLDEVEKYIGIYHEKDGNMFFAKNKFIIWFYDTTDFANKINSGEYDFLMFPNRMKGFSFNSVGIIDEVWRAKYQNKHKGAKNLLGMVQGWYDEVNNKIIIHFMSVRPSAKRNHINSFMVQYAKKVFESTDVVFHEPTAQGYSFIESEKFEEGGDLKENSKKHTYYIQERVKWGEKTWVIMERYPYLTGFAEEEYNGEIYTDENKAKSKLDLINLLNKDKHEEGGDLKNNFKVEVVYDLLAPNGKPSNLTPEQYKLVRSPEFISWFGDWENSPETASKVVDENGEPLVVYHGTNKKFNVFDLSKVGSSSDSGWFGEGFYFAPTQLVADYYGDETIKVFINLKKPLLVVTKAEIQKKYNTNNSSELTEKIIEDGYDGVLQVIVLKNKKTKIRIGEVVAFKPNQIKLADGSNITFDGSNPDIRYAKGGNILNMSFNHENANIWMNQYSNNYSEFTNFCQFILDNKIYENLYNSIIGNYFKTLSKYSKDNNDETAFIKANEHFLESGGVNPISFLSKYVSKYLTKNVLSVIHNIDSEISLYTMNKVKDFILNSIEYKENGLDWCLNKFGYSIVSTKIKLNDFIKLQLENNISKCEPRFKNQLDKARKLNDSNKFQKLKAIFVEVSDVELQEAIELCDKHNSKITQEFPQITLEKTGVQLNYYTLYKHSEVYDVNSKQNIIVAKYLQNVSIDLLKAVNKLISHYPTTRVNLSTDDYRIKSSTKINSQNNPTITFGKYNGKDILSIWKLDKKYCLWLKGEFEKNKNTSTTQQKIYDIISQLEIEDTNFENGGDIRFDDGGEVFNIDSEIERKKVISNIMGIVSFRKFGNAYRKHIDEFFLASMQYDGGSNDMSWKEKASYIIGDGNYSVTKEQFIKFMKEFPSYKFNNGGDIRFDDGGELEQLEIKDNDIKVGLKIIQKKWGGNSYKITKILPNNKAYTKADVRGNYGGNSTYIRTFDEIKNNYIKLIKDDSGKILGFDYKLGKFKYNEGGNINNSEIKIKVYRGIGNNVYDEENDYVIWVAEDRRVAENYSKNGNVIELEVQKPLNPFEIPFNNIYVKGSDIGDRLTSIVNERIQDDILGNVDIDEEKYKKILYAIAAFVEKSGEKSELYSHKTNNKESVGYFVKALKLLGYDGLIQKESYSSESPYTTTRSKDESITYGIFKDNYYNKFNSSRTKNTFDGSNPDIRFDRGGSIISKEIWNKWLKENTNERGIAEYESNDGTEFSFDYVNSIITISRKKYPKGLDMVIKKENYSTGELSKNFKAFDERVKELVFGNKSFKLSDNKQTLIEHENNPDISFEDGGEISKSIDDKLKKMGFQLNSQYRFGKRIDENTYITGRYDKIKNSYVIGGVKKIKTPLGENSIGINFNFNDEKEFIDKINQYLSQSNNPDIKFEDGGGVSFDKVISASTRFRPTETVVFDPPLEGKNGAKLISYTWSYEWTMTPNREGELKSKRISDWTQAEISADTGRDIVHQYTILMPDGEYKTVSSDSVPVLLGYLDKKELKSFPNLVTASKTLAKQQMQLAILEAQKKEYDELIAKFEKADKPEIRIAKHEELPFAKYHKQEEGVVPSETYFIMEDVRYGQFNQDYYDPKEGTKYKLIDKPNRATIEQLTSQWVSKRVEENGGKYPRGLYDLKNRVARQKRKVENILNSKMENGGVVVGEEIKNKIINILKTSKKYSRYNIDEAQNKEYNLINLAINQNNYFGRSVRKANDNYLFIPLSIKLNVGYGTDKSVDYIYFPKPNNYTEIKIVSPEPSEDSTDDEKEELKKYIKPILYDSSLVNENNELIDDRYINIFDYEELDSSVVDEEHLYRGMSSLELDNIISNKYIKSDASMNLQGQEETTSFAQYPSQASSYAFGFTAWYDDVTFENPKYVIKIKREGLSYKPALEKEPKNEVNVYGETPLSNIVDIYEIRLGVADSGSITLKEEFNGNIQEGSRSPIHKKAFVRKLSLKELEVIIGKKYNDGGDIDSNDFDDYRDYDELSGTIVGEVLDEQYYRYLDVFPQTQRFILSQDEEIKFRDKTQDAKDTFKPRGLWYAFGMDWFDAVQSVVPSYASRYNFIHTIKVTDKVCSIKTIEEAIEFTDKYGFGEGHFYKQYLIDWSKVEKDYSGVEALDPIRWCRTEGLEGKLWWMYSWDAASGCIWKSDGIESIEPYDYKEVYNQKMKEWDDHEEMLRREDEERKKSSNHPMKKGGSMPSHYIKIDSKDGDYIGVMKFNPNNTRRVMSLADLASSSKKAGYKLIPIDSKKYDELVYNIDYEKLEKFQKDIDASDELGSDVHDLSFKKGGSLELEDKDSIYNDWKELINMSYRELKSFYDSKEGKEAGLSKDEADDLGIHSGRESAKWILKMKHTKRNDWTDNMWEWAKRQISFVKRMSASKGELYDDNGNKTRKHTSLLIWGHSPEKHKMTFGGYVGSVDSNGTEPFIDSEGRKRFKIDDFNAEIDENKVYEVIDVVNKTQETFTLKLTDFLYNWDGYKYYPNIKNTKVRFYYNALDKINAGQDKNTGDIIINCYKIVKDYEKYIKHITSSTRMDEKTSHSKGGNGKNITEREYVLRLFRRKLFHETQHLLQLFEGIEPISTNIKDVVIYVRKKYNVEHLSLDEFEKFITEKHNLPIVSYDAAIYKEYKDIPTEKECFYVEDEIQKEYNKLDN